MAGDKHIPNTKWNDDRPRQAREMALLGLTDQQMAEVMGVAHDTLVYWKRNKPEFLEALAEGKEIADAKVVDSFYQNCLDRFVDIEEVHVVKGVLKTVTRKKFIQGDKWAQAKWLAVRQRATWSETKNVALTQTNININKFDFTGLSEEELLVLKKAGLNQLTRGIHEIGN